MEIRIIFYSFILFAALSLSCGSGANQSPFSSLDDNMVRTVLERAIEDAGGWKIWQGIQAVSYTKRSVLYFEDGSVESDVIQSHTYELSPDLSGEITWNVDGENHKIRFDQQSAYKEVNGNRQEDKEETVKETFLSAYYVLFIPFKLLDPGTHLEYMGHDTLDGGEIVEIIQATYDPSAHENHSTSDIWWYFFEKEDGRHVGSMVYHEPTYALIEHREMTDEHAIRFNLFRESYRCDSLRNKQFLRARFWYSDYEVR